MPPIVPKRPNPAREALPNGIRGAIDFFFPEDDPFAGLSPSPLSVVEGPSQGLIKALRPLAHGAIERGQSLAEALAGRVKNVMPSVWLEGILGGKPVAPDVAKLAAVDKVTGARPPIQTPIHAPAGFVFEAPPGYRFKARSKAHSTMKGESTSVYPKRSAQLSPIDKIWQTFSEAQPTPNKYNAKPLSSGDPNTRPPLSGRWNNSNRGLKGGADRGLIEGSPEYKAREEARRKAKKGS